MGKVIKLLFLAENPDAVAQDISVHTDAKIICETDIVANTFWQNRTDSPLYSEWLLDRARGLSQVYRHARPVAFVLHQKHQDAVKRVPHDASIRVCENLVPKRLSNAVSYQTDITITQDQITPGFYQQFFN